MTTPTVSPTGEPTAPPGVNPATGEVTNRDALERAQAAEPPERIPFAAFLTEHLRGALHGELTDGLAEVVDGVTQHRKPGELVLKIKVKPEGTTSVTVVHDVTVKAPEADTEPAFYFVDDNANLRRNDPRQRTLDFGDLAEARERRETATDPKEIPR